jgi:hypothetical protein
VAGMTKKRELSTFSNLETQGKTSSTKALSLPNFHGAHQRCFLTVREGVLLRHDVMIFALQTKKNKKMGKVGDNHLYFLVCGAQKNDMKGLSGTVSLVCMCVIERGV